MNYYLGVFEQWIKIEIHPSNIKEKNLKEYSEFVSEEKNRLLMLFRELRFQNLPGAVLNKIISDHQIGIYNICNEIISYECDRGVSNEVVLFYISVRKQLNEILSFMELHVPEHFDLDLPTTAFIADAERESFKAKLLSLTPLYGHPNMERPLLRLALRPLAEFVEDNKRPSYRELAYLKQLSAALSSLFLLDESSDINYELHTLLLHLNYNYPRYVLYCTYRLDEKLMLLDCREKRLEMISWYLRTMKQIEIKPELYYIKGIPSVTQQIYSSIQNAYQHVLFTKSELPERNENNKIRLSISVSVLALFLKLLIKAAIITNQNNAQVFRIVIDNFSTSKTEQLSYESLKGKYNKTPLSAYGILKKMFLLLLNTMKSV